MTQRKRRQPTKATIALEARVVWLRKEGLSTPQIAAQLGVSTAWVLQCERSARLRKWGASR